jgi:hypothetical protein
VAERPLRLEALEQLVEQSASLHAAIARSHPALERGLVQCVTCSAQRSVDPVECLRSGWPRCCGATMRLVTGNEHAGGDSGGGTPPPGPPHNAGEGEAREAGCGLISGTAGGASPTSDQAEVGAA